tara:strand:+ start:474 stop:986 length:513 start_codon:yes stop_codon:yes gene_type:complete
MKRTVTLKGIIKFDPKDKTNKHEAQSEWKSTAMVLFGGDITQYYAWFINRRYNLVLNKPLRGAHVTFINDRKSDMNGKWDEIKAKWHNKEIEVVIDLDPRTDSNDEGSKGHWWFVVPEEDRKQLHGIRTELGLGRPFFGLHMTIGHANEKHILHSKYIHNLIQKGFIKYD